MLETPDCTGASDIKTRSDYYKIHPLEHINGFTPATLIRFAARLGFAHITKPVSSVTCEVKKMAKAFAKRLVRPMLKSTTQMYFLKI